ncbi:acyl-CoA dehydrogenase NM domain-like protein [Sistotremastrum suecicum HHB10207 ss-3]|uniref:Acyl-CoA dehydrogenase NM domain-like protein n=1 Tax=Sistotremastrum suecicum HHB10207 ss-3 TaxID=1314776 RepID=A0A165ZLN6_9AGAM|nr:acyl-CoA dehydrogenase NM domain-like protein [Sistotremastrum suecicum HHB10207 ss-3]
MERKGSSASQQIVPFTEQAWAGSLESPYYRDSHIKLRKYVRQYLETEVFPYAEEWELKGEVPRQAYAVHAAKGFILPGLPRKYRNGKNLPADIPDEEWDLFHNLIITEETSRSPHMGPIWGLGSANTISCPAILNFGTEEQRMKYLPDVHSGKIRFCLGITEPEAGSDVSAIRSTAKLSSDGKNFIVNGSKKWITNGIWADYIVAAVRTSSTPSGASGISLLIIPLSSPGITRRRIANSGVHASGSTFILFSDVLVPRENLLGEENKGFKMVMSNFNPERLHLAGSALQMARTCYKEAYGHALRRKTFGKALIENQVMRAKFAGMARMIESAHAWMEQIVWHIVQHPRSEQTADVGARLALLKVQSGKVLEYCCREAQQVFGGLGYSKEGPGRVVEQISRDLRVLVVGGGSEEILDDLGIKLTLSLAQSKASL